MFINLDPSRRCRQSGVSLVEAVIFIVIVSVGVVGLLGVMNAVTKNSAEPMLRKQAVAIAESLLEEIMQQPFTDCDPEAYDAATGTCTVNETGGPETIGGVPQDRYSSTHPFNNVNDYNGFSMPSGIYSITDGSTAIAGLTNFTASVAVVPAGADVGVAANEALKITVTVTSPIETITLTGYRLKYAPTP